MNNNLSLEINDCQHSNFKHIVYTGWSMPAVAWLNQHCGRNWNWYMRQCQAPFKTCYMIQDQQLAVMFTLKFGSANADMET